ncbi:MAG: dTDP-glucose 4,6-dehydratase [Candidatus Omnitrophota bacterium]|nr:dTDP-glucose 4,6-dehydratase [Candidatus Omnitrophota bacterium]
MKTKILVTGGAGFIGSEFLRQALGKSYKAIVVDKLTYAGDLERLKEIDGKYRFYKIDICDKAKIDSIFKKERPEAVIHFAAETHVDRSIKDAFSFIETNIKGTFILLDASRKYKVKKFIHISTDEVYGDIEKGRFSENSALKPNSPYAASKAAADLLLKAYIRTYSFPGIIVRPSNNYGPWQYPEKLIPLAVSQVLRNKKIPVYAKGKNIREWLYVQDCAKAIIKVLEKGRIGEIYNIGSNQERQNIAVVKDILKILGKKENLIQFVKDRPGHDIRYRLSSGKITKETGWRPSVNFEQGLKYTLNWCKEHKEWLLTRNLR